MDSQAITSRSELESLLFDGSIEPKALTLSLLEDITNSFSEDKEIGSGGFAVVYEGMLDDGIVVAVKKLFETLDIHEKKFMTEVSCLMKVKHKNIVRFLGYCSDTQQEMVDYDGELVLEPVGEKLLCFEYLSNGSLDKKISDASCGLEWRIRYQIIIGICDGLNYLHQNNIIHLDLKPSNILLDENMMPKIADFGLSRCFEENQNQIIISKPIGTMGYLPVESHDGGHITVKTDIYSLGIIIMEIITGGRGHTDVENVVESWRNRLGKSQTDKQLVEVQVCAEMGMQCCNYNPAKRPDIQHIVDRLHATKSADESAPETGTSSSSSAAKLAVVPPGSTTGIENTMANAVLKSKEEPEPHDVTNQNQSFSSMPDNSSNVQQVPNVTEDVEGALIIRKTGEKNAEEKQKIASILSGSVTEDMVILPIYGIGGIGKSTLAQMVFNDPKFQDYTRVWVYVSLEFNLNKIGNSIITQLTGKISYIRTKQLLHKRLRELFDGKSILIVLDDLWKVNPIELDKLKVMLGLGLGNKVIIATTRDGGLARELCSPSVAPYKLETLTVDKCWTIMKQKADFEDRIDQEQLEHIGREIATKCGGVVLAAQSLGYMLKGMTSYEWESVRDSHIWNLSNSEGHEVLAALQLSYSHMSDGLKLCFSYCAIFPKGHKIAKYDLIHQWIALGFIEQSRIFDSMQICEAYVTELLGMSFLEYLKTQPSSDGQQGKDVVLLTMPDIVYDLARGSLADLLNDKGSVGGNRCRYAVLTNCSKPLQLCMTFPENIKAIHFLDCCKLKLHGDAFSLAMGLRVLDLSQCCIQKLPDSVGGLKQLRFLHAPRIQDQIIPNCITELSELTYLNLRGSNISALPESIGDMKGLMHLDLSGCHGIDELPASFTKLQQLVHLDLSHCRMSMSEALGGFTKLQYLNLSVEFTMYTKHMREQTQFISNLIKLRYLNLSGRMKLMAPSEDQIHGLIHSVSRLRNLEHLDLSRNVELSSIPESIGNLRKLHTLDLLGCSNLRNLPDSIVKMVNLNVLHEASLVESTLSRLNFGSLPHFVVHASSDKSNSNIIRLQPTNPYKLTIDRLEHVKSAEEAHSIKLREKQKIEELTFQWTVAAERFVDDKEVLKQLMPPCSVRRLSIAGYRSVSMPDWLMGIRQHLPNLNRIELRDFVMCNKLPSLDALPNLRFMRLSCMDSLEDWNTTHYSGEGVTEPIFPKLRTLIVEQCAKLRIKPYLPRCHVLHITDCDNLISSSGESRSHSGASSSSPAINLIVDGSKVPLHQWRLLHQLPVVRSLTIKHCGDLTTSPEIIKCLSSLESLCLESLSFDKAELPRWLVELTSIKALSLSKCRNLTSLPEWLGDLSSLKKIEILCCQGIRSLPDSIQQLSKLEYLKIRGCPTLRKWCESKENKMKLAHITEKHIW